MSNATVRRLAPRDGGRLPAEWETAENGIPVARYISPEFAALEAEFLWPKVWQMACREEQIPNPGDYIVYDILQESVVVVRVDAETIKAYHNVCPHRATALAVGAGRFQLDQIVCPFHGWRWNLEGENTYLPSPEEIDPACLQRNAADLQEVHLRRWAGFIYVNLDKRPPPFEEVFAPVMGLVDGIRMADMKFHYHFRARVNANWKVAQEAFMEAYHVAATHPQLSVGMTPEEFAAIYTYEPLAHGHGLFHAAGAQMKGRMSQERLAAMTQAEQAEVLLRNLTNMAQGQDAQVHLEEVEVARTMRRKKLPPGMLVGEAFMQAIRDHYDAQGRPLGDFETLAKVVDMHLFPNVTFLPTFGNCVMYRSRPSPDNDPNWSIFETFALRTYAEGVAPPPWRTIDVEGDLNDPKSWFLIPSQDFTSIVRQQRGMRSSSISKTMMTRRQESLIFNMHREVDRYIRE